MSFVRLGHNIEYTAQHKSKGVGRKISTRREGATKKNTEKLALFYTIMPLPGEEG